MPTDASLAELQQHYPCLRELAGLSAAPGGDLPCHLLEVPTGAVLFDEGAPCAGFPLVLEGSVSVARHSASGRALELYRLTPGEICVVSAAALFRDTPLSARAVATTATRLAVVPPELFAQWTCNVVFRNFVFGIFARRLTDLMTLIDAVAFQRLDQRLADHLLGHGGTVLATHQTLADELGTVREIVTRVLRRFEVGGLVRLGRERIDILDAERLRGIANGEPGTL